jgi:polyhydroxybutyrate depolymerase
MRQRALAAVLVFWWSAFGFACSSEDSNPPEGSGNEDPALNENPPGGAGPAALPGADLGEPWAPEDRTLRPSAGCDGGSASPPIGLRRLATGSDMGVYIVTVPPGYDPTVPTPLAFVFHGANNTANSCRGSGNCPGVAEALEGNAVVIYMQSFGTSWTDDTREQNVAWFDDLLADTKQTYCVDERRVFAVGTSSGAHFTNILACRRGDELLAIAPGAGERLEKSGCVGRVAALVLHGVADTSVPLPLGAEARDHYAQVNGCTTDTVPVLSTMHAEVSAAREADRSTYGCVDYEGCREGLPVRWCEHSEPGYDGTTHGFPRAGGSLAWEFFSAL